MGSNHKLMIPSEFDYNKYVITLKVITMSGFQLQIKYNRCKNVQLLGFVIIVKYSWNWRRKLIVENQTQV